MAKKTEAPEPRVLTSLAELGTYEYNVDIELTDGDIIRIEMKTLSLKAWNAAGAEVPDPVAPMAGVDKFERPIYNYNDSGYLVAMNEAANRRAYRRLLVAIKIEVPGATDDERITWLEDELDFGVAHKLVEVMSDMASEVDARIANRAASFPANGTGNS